MHFDRNDDIAAIQGSFRRYAVSVCALCLCGVCAVALLPAVVFAIFGLLWMFPLHWPTSTSAAAFLLGPGPLAFAVLFSWRAAATGGTGKLWAAILFVAITVLLYAAASAWGGRMLI